MTHLPDPRCYGTAEGASELLRLALKAERASGSGGELHSQLRALLEAEDDASLYDALQAAPTAFAYRALWSAICAVAGNARPGDATIIARPFAIPVVLVAGARRSVQVPGALPDIAEIHSLLERQGAVGATRNFGLSAELTPVEALERLRPSRVFRWSAAFSGGMIDGMEGAPIEVAPGREQAHLRFMLGAGITPAHLPSFLETAADIGRWGTLFTKVVARQLAQSGLELLPLARPPAHLLEAAQHGRRAALETAFHLFTSHVFRTCRMTAGEPVVVVSTHRRGRGAEVRISVSSMLDDAFLEGFRWPLHPLDDLDDIEASIAGLLAACRVEDVRWMPWVLEEQTSDAPAAFMSARDFDRAANARGRH